LMAWHPRDHIRLVTSKQARIFSVTGHTVIVSIFFFQAEDGIRDRNVTGVQTCALPILVTITRNPAIIGYSVTFFYLLKHALLLRSEERRVGKECRFRGWSYR